ncbi:SPA2 [Candida pseudojiufengensis]|uniref:SPA2 n=1 Tax=Candida pseudojiufengensis TaxID=497109 RepID=UPI0022243624|nr:SPA2 [Candida pseudojiufengensis]KAI5962412.1 SPA2 [Candida pseudojiufengensis]
MSERDLVHHYRVLKQFLDISDDQQTRTKSTSTRAQRAKEKLLKLSSAQFKELSTDVYDELKRRIDESRGEPDYLLPKQSFHPKRNQARQKLASLPQTRFKDLVADISFEIERRGLHIVNNQEQIQQQQQQQQQQYQRSSSHSQHPSISSNNNHQQSNNNTGSFHERKGSIPSVHSTNNNNNNNNGFHHSRQASRQLSSHLPLMEEQPQQREEEEEELQKQGDNATSSKNVGPDTTNQSIGIQPTTVVPTKANLTWSSDEEEDDEEDQVRKNLSNGNNHHNNNNITIKEIDEKNAKIQELESQLNEYKTQFETLQHEKNSLTEKLSSLQDDYNFSVKQNKSLSEELEALGQEKENWITKHDAISKSINNNNKVLEEFEKVKSINAALRLENQALKNSSPVNRSSQILNKSVTSLNSSSTKVPDNNINDFLDKLENMKSSSSSNNSTTTLELKNQVKLWQRRYEDSRSKAIAHDIKKTALSKIELKPLISPNGLISIKLVSDAQALLESFILYLNGDNVDVNLMFDKISKIAIVMNEIANQSDNHVANSNEQGILLREAAAYSLTATRYHATYKTLFPKFIVEKSLGEMSCILCELISISKLNENSINLRKLDVEKKPSKNIIHENFGGVRPLKMANKLKSNNNSLVESNNTSPNRGVINSSLQNKSVLNASAASPEQKLSKQDEKSSFLDNSRDKQRTPNAFDSLSNNKDFKQGNGNEHSSADDSMSRVKVERSPRLNENDSFASIGRSLEESPEQNSTSKNQPSSSARKLNILERVKQFESPPEQDRSIKSNNSDEPRQLADPFTLNRSSSKNENKEVGSKSEEKEPTSSGSGESSGGSIFAGRGKGIFQSLKERFAAESTLANSNDKKDEVEEKSKDEIKEQPKEQIKESPKTEHQPKHSKEKSLSSITDQNTQLNRNISSTSKQQINPTNVKHDEESNTRSTKPRVMITEPQTTSNTRHQPRLAEPASDEDEEEEEETVEEMQARQRQELRKSMAAANFNVELFDIDDPDNTLTQVLLYLEHQTVEVINTIQSLLAAIKKPKATRGELRLKSKAITIVIQQMTEATNTSMNQTRNAQLKEHGNWVVESLEDCYHRMNILCKPASSNGGGGEKPDLEFADKNFKQRLAGISFDIAKCTKELVKTVEEASLKEDIAYIDARLNHDSRNRLVDEDDLT